MTILRSCDFCGNALGTPVDANVVSLVSYTCDHCGMETLAWPEPVAAESTQADPVFVPEVISFAGGQSGRRGLLYGWGGPEKWGGWSSERWAAFEVPVPSTTDKLHYALMLKVPEKTSVGSPFLLDLFIQERFCGTLTYTEVGEQVLQGTIPLSGQASSGRCVFEFHQPSLANLAADNKGRQGIGLMSFQITDDTSK